MTDSIRPPDPFLASPGTPSVPWDLWVRIFQNYLDALDPDEVFTDKRKVSLLITCLGTEGARIYFTLPVPDPLTFASVETLLRDKFAPTVNVSAARYAFRQRRQQQGENTDGWYIDLLQLVRDCGFGDTQDDMVRDMIVENSTNPRIQERLLMEKNLTLQKALEIARLVERAQADSRTMRQRADNAASVNAVQHRKGQFRNSRFQGQTSQQRLLPAPAANARHAPPASGFCFRCGSKNHKANFDKCPARTAQCRHCQRIGHFDKVCNSKRTSANVHSVDTAEDTFLLNIRSSNDPETVNSLDPILVDISLHDKAGRPSIPCSMLYDSGSRYSLIPRSFYERYLHFLQLQPSSVRLQQSDLSGLCVDGQICATFTYNSRSVSHSLLVVDKLWTQLLGRDLIQILNISLDGATLRVCVCDVPALTKDEIATKFPILVDKSMGEMKKYMHRIKLKPDAVPVAQKLRNPPIALLGPLKKELDKLDKDNVIEKLDSAEWVHPLVVTPKRDSGEIRVCCDLRTLNRQVIPEKYPVPNIETIFTKVHGATILTVLDLRKAFFQMRLAPESRHLTAFLTPWGLYQFVRMPMGSNSGTPSFQKAIELILAGLPNQQPSTDDILVWGKDNAEHNRCLEAVLQRLAEYNLRLSLDKCAVGQSEVKFLGHLFSGKGISPLPSNVQDILSLPAPTNVKEVRSFLGMCSYYLRFLPDFATISEPLRALTRDEATFSWSREAETAFSKLKDAISSTPVLAMFDPAAPTFVSTDASGVGLGAVLSQIQNGVERPVAFASRTLTPRERNFSTGEREALACVWSCERWHTFLWGRRFTLRTDAQALTTLLDTGGKGHKPMRISWWYARMLPYSYDVQYRPGSENQVADALSRLPVPCTAGDTDSDCDIVAFVSPEGSAISAAEFKAETAKDPVLSDVLKFMQTEWPKNPKKLGSDIQPFFKLRDELFASDGCLFRGNFLLIPPDSLRSRLISLAHSAHPGISRTKQRLRDCYWWPKLNQAVEFAVQHCASCQESDKTAKVRQPPLQPVEFPHGPWEKLAIDITGPFHSAPQHARFLIVLADYYSKYPEVLATGSITSSKVIDFLETVFIQHGYPDELVSDNGTQFTSFEFASYLKKRNIRHTRVAVYNPSSNGFVERLNRSLENSLQATLKDGTPWIEALRAVLQTHRTTPHRGTGKTPTELLFNRKVRTQVSHPFTPRNAVKSADAAFRARVHKYQESYRSYADSRNASATPTHHFKFKVGQYARVKLPHSLKGDDSYSRPLRIQKRVGKYTFLLETGQRWNLRRLTPASPPTTPENDNGARPEDVFDPAVVPPVVHPALPPGGQPAQAPVRPPRNRRPTQFYQAGFA